MTKAAVNIRVDEVDVEAPLFSLDDLRGAHLTNTPLPVFTARDRQIHLEQAVFNAMFQNQQDVRKPSFNARQLLTIVGVTVPCWAAVFALGALILR